MEFTELEKLSERSQQIASMTTQLEMKYGAEVNLQKEYLDLKKEYHSVKLTMIELVEQQGEKVTVTARMLREKVRSTPRPPKYETGIAPLDRELDGGIELGTFVLLGGESFVGKTHLTTEILTNVAKHKNAVFYNFEMGEHRIVDKLEKIITEEPQWDNLIINEEDRELRALSADIKIRASSGIKYFVIDSKMKIDVAGDIPEYMKNSAISKELSKVAQKCDIIIMLINQMNEDDIKHQRLAFKGSGDQQYDSDLSLFYVKDQKTNERTLICNKNRQVNGREFKIDLDVNYAGKTVERGFRQHEGAHVSIDYVHEEIRSDSRDEANTVLFEMPEIK